MTEQTDEAPAALDLDAMSKSLTGFEQIAIREMFRTKLESLGSEAMMFMRAMLFVAEKRAGMGDHDAFRKVMNLPLDAVVARFPETPSPEAEEDAEAVAERDKAYAEFVVGVGLSFMPEQYLALTLGQRAALVDAANRRLGG